MKWHFKSGTNRAAILDSNGNSIASLIGLSEPSQIESNGKLLAAAPELLEAAKALEKHILDKGWSTKYEFETLNKLSSAIKKAEGK